MGKWAALPKWLGRVVAGRTGFVAGMSNSSQLESGIWVQISRENAAAPCSSWASQRGRGIAWLPDKSKLILGLSERTPNIVLFDQGS